MEIMKTNVTSLRRFISVVLGLALFSGTCFADTLLHKVPAVRPTAASSSSAAFAFVNLSETRPRAIYVSSGAELKNANNMVDGQLGTSFAFGAADVEPTAVIDLGSIRSIRRLNASYPAQKTTMNVYVLNALPAFASQTASADLPPTIKVDASIWDQLKPAAVCTNDGSQAGSSVEFAPATGRYVILRWAPAARTGTAFTVAEVAVADEDQGSTAGHSRRRFNDVTDSKDVADTKDVVDNKDVPEEGPEAPPPSEGPPPTLPPPPPFTFIPQLVPTSE
jgi:hypothetical protein